MPNFSALLHGAGQRALSAGGLGATGAGLGAAAGTLLGGRAGYREAKERGESGVGGALRGALRGAGRGAALGGAAGVAGGALGGAKAQELTRSISGIKGARGSLSRFGERQVHSLTGALPAGMSRAEGLRAIGGSSADDLAKQVGKLKKAPLDTGHAGALEANVKRHKEIGRLEKAQAHAARSEELGATSIPGLAKALVTNPKDTLTSAVGQQWHSSGPLGKALTFGLPAAAVAREASRESQPGEASRGARALRSVAETAPLALTPSLGILGSTALGAGVTTALGKKRVAKQLQGPEDVPLTGAVERVYSPAAQGQLPEGMSTL